MPVAQLWNCGAVELVRTGHWPSSRQVHECGSLSRGKVSRQVMARKTCSGCRSAGNKTRQLAGANTDQVAARSAAPMDNFPFLIALRRPAEAFRLGQCVQIARACSAPVLRFMSPPLGLASCQSGTGRGPVSSAKLRHKEQTPPGFRQNPSPDR